MWFMIAMPVQAEQSVSLVASFFTIHVAKDDDKTYNEDNNLWGVEYKVDEWSFHLTTYDNTIDKRSETIGVGYNLLDYKYFEFDALFGFATGYKRVIPYVAPRATFKYDISKCITIKNSTEMFGKAVISTIGIEYKF